MRATARPELAADLAAETFARALESLAAYDPPEGEQTSGCSGSLATSWARAIARAGSSQPHASGSAYRAWSLMTSVRRSRSLSEREDQAVLALAGLPDEQQHAIQARVVEGRDYAEIAGELSCSEAVVRQRVSRGLSTLRARLAGER